MLLSLTRLPMDGKVHRSPSPLTGYIVPRMVTNVARKKISTTVYITPEQDARLKLLHERTKVPIAVYIREGIDLVLEKHKELLPGQVTLFDPE